MTLPAQDIVERLPIKRQIEYALFLAAGQDDPHSVTITELCASLSRLTADNEALRKERDEAIAAHHRTSHKAVKRLRALWREKQAAESRVTALEARLAAYRQSSVHPDDYERLREALEKLLRLTVFELGDNVDREPWKRNIAHCCAALGGSDHG